MYVVTMSLELRMKLALNPWSSQTDSSAQTHWLWKLQSMSSVNSFTITYEYS